MRKGETISKHVAILNPNWRERFSEEVTSKAKHLGLVHWDDPEGWNGEGGGRRVQDGEHM